MSEGPSLAACAADDPSSPAVRAADAPVPQRQARRRACDGGRREGGRKVEMAVGERDAGEERGDGRREEGRWRRRPEGGRRQPA